MSSNTIGITLTVTDRGTATVKQFAADTAKATKEMADKGSANVARLAEDVVRKTQEMYTKGAGAAQRLAESVGKSLKDMAGRSSNPISSMGDSLISTLGGAIGKVGGFLTSLKTIAVGALAGWGVKSLADQFIGVGDSMEKMKLTLDTITKGGGDVWLEKLNAWALKMPVNTEKAIQSFVMMRGMGLKPTIDQMTTLVDTTSALGGQADALSGIARALGQMQAKGKLTTEELMQLAERGVPAMEILKEKLHLTGAQVADIGNQAVSADVGIKALLEGMAERFGGQSAKIQGTWGGLMESLKGYWAEFTRLVMDSGVMDTLKDKLGGVIAKLDQMLASGELKRWATETGAQVAGALSKIWDTGKNLVAWWQEHGEAVKDNIALAAKIAWELGQLYVAAKLLAGYAALIKWWKAMEIGALLAAGSIAKVNTALKANLIVLGLYAAFKLGEWLYDFFKGTEDAKAAQASVVDSAAQAAADKLKVVSEAAQVELDAMRATLLEDRDTLQARAAQYKAYIDQTKEMVKKAADEEKKLVKDLNELYKQKLDLLASTEDKVRSLQEIGMSEPEKYSSQSSALGAQYTATQGLAGQAQIDALEKYKSSLTSFAQTWSKGVTDAAGTVVTSGQDIINQAIAELESVGNQQQQILAGLQQAKSEQLGAWADWAAKLKDSAQATEAEMATLEAALTAIGLAISEMPKTIEINGKDQASSVLAEIKKRVDGLHDKVITVTVNQVTRYTAADAPASTTGESALFPGLLGSYAKGTNYVPATGRYQLHQGEIVIPSAEAELVRSGRASVAEIVAPRYTAADAPVATTGKSALFPGVLDSYAQGTNYVPATGRYQLHQGEIVIPSAEAELVRAGQPYTVKGVSLDSASSGQAAAPSLAASYNSVLNSYATGTNYVPATGRYQLHQGEIVIPSAEAELVRSGRASVGAGHGPARNYAGADWGTAPALQDQGRAEPTPAAYLTANDYGARSDISNNRNESSSSQVTTINNRGGNTTQSSTKKYGDLIFNFPVTSSTSSVKKDDMRRMVREQIVPELRQLGLVHA